ncbi:unnamed protein product [Tilletia caries]|uniref:ASX DEUBAD domain-containing protein n=1 Tax=Tilletia caries TaxID=13290 RepID=A0ABN7J7K3_9BASI|nr:unnamed protein product [Tilletia caries]
MPPPPPLSRQQSKAGAASTSLARTYSAISLLQGGEQLDALSLGLLRRKNFGTFPASAMQEGNKLWAAFQTDPIVDDQRQLLKGYKSGASESGLGKRRRRAPGDLSDYVTDGEGRSVRQETAGSGSTTATRQAK